MPLFFIYRIQGAGKGGCQVRHEQGNVTHCYFITRVVVRQKLGEVCLFIGGSIHFCIEMTVKSKYVQRRKSIFVKILGGSTLGYACFLATDRGDKFVIFLFKRLFQYVVSNRACMYTATCTRQVARNIISWHLS